MKKVLCLLLGLLILFTITSSVSAIHIENEIYKDIPPETKVSELKELLTSVIRVESDGKILNDDDYVKTGSKIITDNKIYTASVLGDINGDGKATGVDYLLAKRYCISTTTLSDLQLLSADVDSNGRVNTADCLMIKRFVIGTFTIGDKDNATEVPVLLYHHILPDEDKENSTWRNNEITITTSEFRRHMQHIKDEGFTVITIDDLVEYIKGERTLPEKSVVLTFDDGYKSNTYYAAPILREFGYKATVFSIMSWYDYEYEPNYRLEELQHITRNDLNTAKDVFEQQCHTFNNHNELNLQSYNTIYNDLILSQNLYPAKYFAYPFGVYDDEVIVAVKNAGFEAAFTTVSRDAKVGENLYEIPRKTITSPMTDQAYLNLLLG